jgi:hypothetical protein
VTGHPDTAETYDLGNGSLPAVDQRRVIDAGFLELTRLGELPASDPDVLRSLVALAPLVPASYDKVAAFMSLGAQSLVS